MIEYFASFAFACTGLALLGLAYRFVRQAWADEARVKLSAIAIDADSERKNAELRARLDALGRLTGKPTPPSPPPGGTKKAPPLVKLVRIDGGDSKK